MSVEPRSAGLPLLGRTRRCLGWESLLPWSVPAFPRSASLVTRCLPVPSALYLLVAPSTRGRGWRAFLMFSCLSFPGGKCDPQDQDIVDTALRETREELGLPIQEENVWGVMRPVNDRKNFIVVPVIAQVGPLESLDLMPNPQEVDDIFTMPLAHLLHPRNQGYTHFCHRGHYSYTMPIFLHGPYRIWGLTAIFTELTLEMLVPGTYHRIACFGGQQRRGGTRS